MIYRAYRDNYSSSLDVIKAYGTLKQIILNSSFTAKQNFGAAQNDLKSLANVLDMTALKLQLKSFTKHLDQPIRVSKEEPDVEVCNNILGEINFYMPGKIRKVFTDEISAAEISSSHNMK